MKTRCLFIPFALGLGLALILLWKLDSGTATVGAAPSNLTSFRYVTITGTNSGDCSMPISPCLTIQYAVDQAGDGDVIKVATGVYSDVHEVRLAPEEYITQVVYLDLTAVTIWGGYSGTDWTTSDPDAYPTTLDARGQGRVFYIESGAAPVIEGLRITGGDATKGDTTDPGVGSWGRGGGLYAVDVDVTFRNNYVFGNTANSGGGLFLRAGGELSGNTITSNTADQGGGLSLLWSDLTVSGNTILSNTAAQGGGLLLFHSSDTLINNVIADNDVSAAGGGLYIEASSPYLLHTAIARNNGDEGVYVTGGSDVELVNTILSTHTVGISATMDSEASLDYTLWHANATDWSGNVSHTNDRNGDPDFADPDAGDYHISSVSAALDQGVDAGIIVDMDGEQRPRGDGYDIGPDEYPDFLSVVKEADPMPAQAGEQLIYTIRVTNFSNVTYTATITDFLPEHVTYTEVVTTWTSQVIAPEPEYPWIRYITVTVEAGYSGLLINIVEVTTEEGETGAATLVVGSFVVHLPLVLRNA